MVVVAAIGHPVGVVLIVMSVAVVFASLAGASCVFDLS